MSPELVSLDFKGDDIRQLVRIADGLTVSAKGEFETREEYEERRDKEVIKAKGVFTFVAESGSLSVQYGADLGAYVVRLPQRSSPFQRTRKKKPEPQDLPYLSLTIAYDTKESTAAGQNIYGATAPFVKVQSID